ncbi:MAG: hypothetical protein LBN27_06735 [Prevotellaceae bacterium]|jgi:hypothetical protein|nr:hypothetical protein [Prevotellaceae bacterium]
MRKLIFIVSLFAFASNAVFAQDLIVTKDAKKIEAKVTEINATDIKYKLFNNLEGPTYTMQKSEISSVIYKNGTIDVFENNTSTAQKLVEKNDNSLVRRDFLKLDDKEQEEYLERFNTELYEKFHKGQRLSRTGQALIGAGGGAALAGVIFLGLGSYTLDDTFYLAYGTACVIVGNIIIIPGIPLAAAGGAMKRSVQNEYEKKYLTHTNPKGQFQLQMSGNGLGLAYVF